MKKSITVVLIVVAVFACLFAAAKKHAPKAPPPTSHDIWAKQGIPVETTQIIRGDIDQYVEVTGDIDALDKLELSAKIAGRVLGINAREGDSISKGESVVMLDQEDALANLQQAEAGLQSALIQLSQAKTNAKVTRIQTSAAVEQAKSSLQSAVAKLKVTKRPSRNQEMLVAENNVSSAKANLDNAESNYRRNQQLVKQGAISESDFDTVKSQYLMSKAQYKSAQDQLSLIKEGGRSEDILSANSQVSVAKEQLRTAKANLSNNMLRIEDVKAALANVEHAKAALALAKQQLSYTYVKSTISGQLSSRATEPGQVIAAGQTLGEVVNLKSLFFKGDISEKEIVGVHSGQVVKVAVDAIPGKTFFGRVDKIYPSGSTSSRNFPVRIGIRENNEIKPGMFARGQVITGQDKNVLLVSKDAIEEREGTKMIFTVSSNKAKRHDVEVIRENREYSEIKCADHLNPGDIVATAGKQNLQDGTLVLVKK